MRSDKDNIEHIFRSKLEGFEPELPPFGWEKIDADLSARRQENIIPLKKRTSFPKIVSWISAAAAVILAVVLLYPYSTKNKHLALNIDPIDKISTGSYLKNLFAQKEKSEDSNTNDSKTVSIPHNNTNTSLVSRITDKEENTVTQKNNPLLYTNQSKEIIDTYSDTKKEDEFVPETNLKEENSDIYLAKEDKNWNNNYIQDNEVLEKELAEKIAVFEAAGKANENILADNNPPKSSNKNANSSNNRLEIGLGGGGAFSKASEIQSQLRVANMEFLNNDGNQMVNSYKPRRMKLNHNQPINFGINISKKLTNRLSIESGIMYTYLSSKIKSTENMDYKLKDSQEFHYLGIPVTLNYRLFEWNKLQLYISAGGAVQKDIYGKMKTKEDLQNHIDMEKYETKNISQDHIQLSATASLGVSYPIYKKMSVFTNLGGSYYFDANNKYETIYSDRKWIFNINLGVKFGL